MRPPKCLQELSFSVRLRSACKLQVPCILVTWGREVYQASVTKPSCIPSTRNVWALGVKKTNKHMHSHTSVCVCDTTVSGFSCGRGWDQVSKLRDPERVWIRALIHGEQPILGFLATPRQVASLAKSTQNILQITRRGSFGELLTRQSSGKNGTSRQPLGESPPRQVIQASLRALRHLLTKAGSNPYFSPQHLGD